MQTLLMVSVINNQNDIVDHLLANDADMTLQDVNGYTALHYAGEQNKPHFLKKFLLHNNFERGLLEKRNKFNETCVSIAVKHKMLTVLKLMSDKGADFFQIVGSRNSNLLHVAAFNFDFEVT
jgi:ankyrin repeat protein